MLVVLVGTLPIKFETCPELQGENVNDEQRLDGASLT
jgi:hypothetical protein